MNSEFLMPVKYEGYGCGLTVAVFGLNNNIQYDKIAIYIEGREENKYCVDVDSSNNFKTTNVTFGGLEENIFYNVIAEFTYNGSTTQTQARMVPTIRVDTPQVMTLFEDTDKIYPSGGLTSGSYGNSIVLEVL